MKKIVAPTATGLAQEVAAAAVPAGTLVQYTYPFGGKVWAATGKVVKAEGTQLHVKVVTHQEFPEYAGGTMAWSACWCEKV